MSKVNLQGSTNHFGPRTSEVDSSAEVGENIVRTLVMPLYTTAGSAALHAARDSNDTINVIPAYSLIRSAAIYVEDAFTRTATATGIDVGIYKTADDTALDADGLIAVGGVGALANLTANQFDEGDGALIGNELTEEGYIYGAWAGGTDTLTGTAVVVVEFIPPLTHILAHKT